MEHAESLKIIAFEGIDTWNRPVFKAVESDNYYGSVDLLFSDDATESDVLNKLDESNLVWFGTTMNCEPMGSAATNIVITPKEEKEFDHIATYSPDDNKLRLYPSFRLDIEDYNKLSEAGIKWAPRQKIFVAPKWTPGREDLLLSFCGVIGDEDTSLVDRAEERAECFEGYSEKRAKEAVSAQDGVEAIASHIPFGQPILVGHHSEKRARRDIQKMDDGMRKSIRLWDTSEYWTQRAAGALSHAKYKERPDVRARRIKKIEANVRRCMSYYTPNPKIKSSLMTSFNDKEQSMHVYCGNGRGGSWVKETNLEAIEKSYARWIAHYENRLAYEKAMLEAQGASHLLEKAKRPKQPPLCNYKAPEGIQVENRYRRGEFSQYPQVEMTKAEYSRIHSDYKGTRLIENSHRVRVTYRTRCGETTFNVVYFTDSKVHKKPEPVNEK